MWRASPQPAAAAAESAGLALASALHNHPGMKRPAGRARPIRTAPLAAARGGADGDVLLHRWQSSGVAAISYFDGKLLTAEDLEADALHLELSPSELEVTR